MLPCHTRFVLMYDTVTTGRCFFLTKMLGTVMMKMIIKCYVDVDHSRRPVTSRLLYLSASRGVYYSQYPRVGWGLHLQQKGLVGL